MKKRWILIVGALLVFGMSALLYFSWNVAQPASEYVIPDTPEAKEVMNAVERAYDVQAEAKFYFDIKKLPDVFINDPRFPVSSSTLKTIRELTNNPSVESAGYLDYKVAYYSWLIESTLHAEEVKEKAKQENRPLTEEESKSLVDQNGRIAPARSESPKRTLPLTFLSVSIDEDVATVVLDDGPWTLEMYLVLSDKKWYVAGTKGLFFHP